MRTFSKHTLSLAKIAALAGAETTLSPAQLEAIFISGITQSDSNTESGDLFVAVAGARYHGADFAKAAISKGAVAVLTDTAGAKNISGVPVLVVRDPRMVLGQIAALLYNEPMRDLSSIGITGTNGKTTVTTFLYQIFEAAHRECGLIGTIETRIGQDSITSNRTTPEASELQSLAAVMRERHMRHLVMEVSSHAMSLHRMQGAHFNFAGFTNLSQDHLDFHGNMEAYYLAKESLFTFSFADTAVINIDNKYGARLEKSTELPVITISRSNPQATWSFIEIDDSSDQVELKVRGSGGILIETRTSIRGGYNFDNLLMAIAIAVESGIDPIEVAMIIPTLKSAAGRLEAIYLGQDFAAFVDYAHTPDAVFNVLGSIREFTSGKIIAVLGCGGDRDPEKRPLMGTSLIQGSDVAIFTNDNPRSEDPELILKAMIGENQINKPSCIIPDRKSAIEYAVSIASAGDTVVILGKGHELGQEIAGEIIDFDDRRVLADSIAGAK